MGGGARSWGRFVGVLVLSPGTLAAACESSAPGAPREEVAAPPRAAPPRCLVPLPARPAPAALRANACPPDPTGPLALPRGWVTFPDAPGKPRAEVEIARTGPARERGLMYRTEMPEEQGMIFSWESEEPRTFWMHHTCLPLDMLFIAKDGTLLGVLEQVPVLDDSPRGVPCPAAHVLELNAGWVRRHGVAPGQRVLVES